MKLKKVFIALVVLGFGIFCLYKNTIKEIKGKGSFDDPYRVKDVSKIIELEEIFKNNYTGLIADSDKPFDESIDELWINENNDRSNDIYIQSIRHIGNQKQATMMIYYTCNAIEEDLKKDVINRFKNEEIMITTSYYSLNYSKVNDIDTSLFNSANADKFSLCLADHILNDYAKIIIEYKINLDDEWYFLSSMINIENPEYMKKVRGT